MAAKYTLLDSPGLLYYAIRTCFVPKGLLRNELLV